MNLKKKKSKKKSIPEVHFSKSKIEKMKLFAQQLSQKIVQQADVSKQKDGGVSADETKVPPQPSTSTSQQVETTKKENPTERNAESDGHIEKNISNDKNCSSNEERNETKKKKKRKKHLFEGEYVPYLVKSKVAKHTEKEETEIKAEDDEYVLKKLFTKSGNF